METKTIVIIVALGLALLFLNQSPKQAGLTVVLRTSAPGGTLCPSSVLSATEMLVDTNGDGSLECYKKTGTTSRTPLNCYAITPDGCQVCSYSATSSNIYVENGLSSENVFGPSTSCIIPSGTEPTEPYSTNGQEVYSGTAPPPTGDACFDTFITCANTWVTC